MPAGNENSAPPTARTAIFNPRFLPAFTLEKAADPPNSGGVQYPFYNYISSGQPAVSVFSPSAMVTRGR